MKNKIQTYGKRNILERTFFEVKNRFQINPLTENMLNEQGLKCYITKLNKPKFIFSIILALVFIALPFVTILSVPTIIWGLR